MQATWAILRGRYDEGMALAQEAGPSGAARCAAGWYSSPRSPPRRCLLNTASDSSLASIDTSLTQWIALRLVALPSTSPWWDSPQTVMAPQNDGVSPDDPLPLSLPPGPAPVAPPNAAAVLNLTAADYGRMAAALTLYQVPRTGRQVRAPFKRCRTDHRAVAAIASSDSGTACSQASLRHRCRDGVERGPAISRQYRTHAGEHHRLLG